MISQESQATVAIDSDDAPLSFPMPPPFLMPSIPPQLLSAVLNSQGMALLVLDANLRLVFASDSYMQLLDMDPAQCAVGMPLEHLPPGAPPLDDGAETWDSRLHAARCRGKIRLVRQSSAGQMIEETGAPLPDGGYSFALRDATEQFQAANHLKAANRATIQALAGLAEYRDNDTGDHVIRVARMSQEITRTLLENGEFQRQITPEFRAQVGVASMLHDVGKVAISDSVLHKPGLLTPEERRMMQRHSVVGSEILSKAMTCAPNSAYLRQAALIARHHHEHYNGKGYPDGLSGETIPLEARIVAVADVYDALTSSRPYKEPWSEEKTIAYLQEQAGSQFDPKVVAAALQVLESRKQTPVIKWNESMSVGHPMLDRDHRTLISLVNQLSHPANRQDRTVLEFVLDELLDYTVAHFSREEQFLEENNYSDLTRHLVIHRSLTNQLASIRNAFISGAQDMGTEVSDFVAHWLRNHIMREDLRYADEITEEKSAIEGHS